MTDSLTVGSKQYHLLSIDHGTRNVRPRKIGVYIFIKSIFPIINPDGYQVGIDINYENL